MVIPLIITCLVTVLSLLAQHYFPWQMLLRRKLPPLLAYTLGTASLIVPLSGLFLFWIYNPPAWSFAYLAAIWAVAGGGGLAVCGCYALDFVLDRLMQARELEELLDHERQAER